MSKKPTKVELQGFADKLREKASVPRQNEVFQAAVEAAHIASHADGGMDDAEKKAIVDALDILSQGTVIEWEVDLLLEAASKAEGGVDARAKKIGEKLKAVGEPEAAFLVAAFVAQSTSGIDQKEAKILKSIAKAAGIADKRCKEILKDVGADPGD